MQTTNIRQELRDLYPEFDDALLLEIQEGLDRYLGAIIRIGEHFFSDPQAMKRFRDLTNSKS